jgi:hypothetical protein
MVDSFLDCPIGYMVLALHAMLYETKQIVVKGG